MQGEFIGTIRDFEIYSNGKQYGLFAIDEEEGDKILWAVFDTVEELKEYLKGGNENE